MKEVRRRSFLLAAGALLSAPLAKAQQGARQYRIGILQLGNQANLKRSDEAFLAGLRDRGYVIGRNLIADFRYGDSFERAQAQADELISFKPDLLVGTEVTGFVMMRKVSSIPIVLLVSADPVAAGLVKSLARPGTNVTGMSFSMFALVAKQIELLAEIVPGMSRIAMLTGTFNPPKDSPYYGRPDAWEVAARQAAAAKGLTLVVVRADDSANLREAFATLKRERAEGLVMATNALVTRMHSEVIAEIQRLRMPAISGYAAFAGAGGLLSYGGNFLETNHYAAKFVDLILKGANPSDLPVEQISKYEMVVNQKSARELGLKVPQSILVRADRVIE